MTLELRPVNLDTFEKACLMAGLDPDEVRASKEAFTVELAGRESAFLTTVLTAESFGSIEPELIPGIAGKAIEVFFAEAREQLARAHLRAAHYAERTGVLGGGSDSGEITALERILVKLDPRDYHTIRHVLSLEDAIAYVLNRTLYHIADHPEEYV